MEEAEEETGPGLPEEEVEGEEAKRIRAHLRAYLWATCLFISVSVMLQTTLKDVAGLATSQ